ncbi:Uncharacterised protein [Mycobacteroides abscessus subsp. bolletii]|nr:Uncharacterised protein [Mycobacteroides abscessus subsp. bolletii]SKH11786.1 Uncharacterised protein [Mycobacteroides abscessus subsp. bolletii]
MLAQILDRRRRDPGQVPLHRFTMVPTKRWVAGEKVERCRAQTVGVVDVRGVGAAEHLGCDSPTNRWSPAIAAMGTQTHGRTNPLISCGGS